MIEFPCAKINLGLNITERRPDGYHNLQTVFYPIPLHDVLEVNVMDKRFPSPIDCDLKTSGNTICCCETDNLIVKAYNLLAHDYTIPRIHAHLYKLIPSEAGLGGGSSDAAFMLKLLNKEFELGISNDKMEDYASRLGADCAFFIKSAPAYAEGIGEILSPITITNSNLSGYTIVVVKPPVAVSTKEAFSHITPHKPNLCCKDIVVRPVETWRDVLVNDFENSVFLIYPELATIKDKLYSLGASYAQMSGSGSSLFGLFKNDIDPKIVEREFVGCKTYTMKL